MEPRTEPCPGCGATLTVDPRFQAWCPACDWNIRPATPSRPPTTIERIDLVLGRRFARRLFEERRGRPATRPRLRPPTILAVVAAVAVYALALLFAFLGFVMLTQNGLNPLPLVIAAFFLLLAWVMRPRLPMLDEPTLGRAELPALFRFLDRLAAAQHSRPIDGVVIGPEFNAGFGRFGWRRRRILFLGLPLVLALEPQERVAVIGHELGHATNGDPGRLVFVTGARSALAELFDALEPRSLTGGPEDGAAGLLGLPFRIVQLGIARLVLAALSGMVLLTFLDGQRAEYYADAVGAKLAGRDAMIAAFRRLHAGDSVARMTWLGGTRDPVGAIVERVRALPAHELERIARVERLEGTRLAFDHPPTTHRVEVVAARPSEPAVLVLTAGESAAIDAELERFRAPIGRTIVDRYLNAIA